ncbi:MAG TPA: hypothetical protein VFM25_04620 [Verrucomicrobiae bacterium]|nr:hypothetical protein [Verrucomicrobiae bacterium]
MRELLKFSHLLIASVPAGERRHFRARARIAASGAVVAISKNVPFQWRKKGGRWDVPAQIAPSPNGIVNIKFRLASRRNAARGPRALPVK